MSALGLLRRFWAPVFATIVLACFSSAVAQTSYKVIDLGALNNGVFSSAMGLNNRGWTESTDGYFDASGNFVERAVVNVSGFKIDLGTLGGRDSATAWGGINQSGEAVGLAETSIPDPDGEDACAFGTHLTCRPFLWRNGHMTPLPTLGGNNGQASAINSQGEIAGVAETPVLDTTCPFTFHIFFAVLWQGGAAQQLNPVAGDPDATATGINDLGQVVGASGTCFEPFHAVLWQSDGTAINLPSLAGEGTTLPGNNAIAINNRGQIVGESSDPDGSTFYAALWQNGTVTNLGTLPGDFAAFATGINDKGQVVGTTLDSSFNLSHAFIWQNGVMTDLNTLFLADSNLFALMADKINSVGQISGMATVLSGPNAGEIHAFLATPVNTSLGASVAAVATTHPKSALPANVRKQLLQRLGLGRFGR